MQEYMFFHNSVTESGGQSPTLGMFHGGYISGVSYTNVLTRFISDGTMKGIETGVSYAVGRHSGAKSDVNALFRGGHTTTFNKSFQVSPEGTLVSDQINVGSYREYKPGGGNVDTIAMFYGGGTDLYTQRLITRINPNNTLLEEKVSGSSSDYAKTFPAMVSLTDSMMAYSSGSTVSQNTRAALLFNANGIITAYELYVGTSILNQKAGAAIGDLGVFYAGGSSTATTNNLCIRINKELTQVGNNTSIGTARRYTDGATVDNLALFYGGFVTTVTQIQKLTRINENGALASIESNAGSGRYDTAGTGI